jgi:hypothetical protein
MRLERGVTIRNDAAMQTAGFFSRMGRWLRRRD